MLVNQNKLHKIPFLTFALIFFSMLPVTMIVPVFKDLVKDKLGGDNLMVSYFMSVAMLGSFLFSPVAGYLSDKLGSRKWLIAIFSFFDGFFFFLIPSVNDLSSLQAVRFLEGGCHIFVISLLLSLIADRENDPSNEKFYNKGLLLGMAGMLLSLGVGLGSPLGALGRKNPMVPFYVAGIIMLGIGLVSVFALKDYENRFSKKFSFHEWLSAFRQNKFLIIPYIYNFIDRFTVGFFVTSFSLYLRESLKFNPGEVGLLLSLVLIPMSLFSLPFALIAKKTGPFILMVIGSLMYGISLGIAGFQTDYKWLVVFLVFCGIGAGVMFVPSMMLSAKLVPREYNASNMAVFTGVGSIGFMLGPIVSVLLDRYIQNNYSGTSYGFIAMIFGSLEIIVVFLTLPFYKRLKV
jgi:MFS family permease